MSSTENYFQKYPCPEEKNDRWRKYNLILASTNPQQAVEKICKAFFTKKASKDLMNPDKCCPTLQKIMSSTNHMEDLSDFVAICFVFTYINYQSQPHSIALLRTCLLKDFNFEDDELVLMNNTMIKDPPQSPFDRKFCSQIIALTCKKSAKCAKFLVEHYQHKCSESQAIFLNAITKEISLDYDPKYFSETDLQIINSDLEIVRSSRKKRTSKSTEKIFKIAENKKKRDKLSNFFRSYQAFIFIILTIVVLLLIIFIV